MDNESDKQAVTRWLGECWHELEGLITPICSKCHALVLGGHNRTFTEWDDFGACWRKLKEKGQIDEFYKWGYDIWWDEEQPYTHKNIWYAQWLLSTTEDGTFRLCNLIAEAIKEGMIK